MISTTMKKVSLLVFSLLLIAVPYVFLPTVAQADGCDAIDKSSKTYLSPDSPTPDLKFLPRYCSIGAVTQRVLNIAFSLIAGVSLLFVVIGGYQYMTAGGNEEKLTSGKKTVLYAILGLVVVITAVTVVNIVINLILYGRTF